MVDTKKKKDWWKILLILVIGAIVGLQFMGMFTDSFNIDVDNTLFILMIGFLVYIIWRFIVAAGSGVISAEDFIMLAIAMAGTIFVLYLLRGSAILPFSFEEPVMSIASILGVGV